MRGKSLAQARNPRGKNQGDAIDFADKLFLWGVGHSSGSDVFLMEGACGMSRRSELIKAAERCRALLRASTNLDTADQLRDWIAELDAAQAEPQTKLPPLK
jgi:hypothetical protein